MLRGNLSHWETDGLFGSDDDATPVMEYFDIKEYGLDTNVVPISISDKNIRLQKIFLSMDTLIQMSLHGMLEVIQVLVTIKCLTCLD